MSTDAISDRSSLAEMLEKVNRGRPGWEYQKKYGPFPPGVARMATVLGRVDELENACAVALKAGKPIDDWRLYAQQ